MRTENHKKYLIKIILLYGTHRWQKPAALVWFCINRNILWNVRSFTVVSAHVCVRVNMVYTIIYYHYLLYCTAAYTARSPCVFLSNVCTWHWKSSGKKPFVTKIVRLGITVVMFINLKTDTAKSHPYKIIWYTLYSTGSITIKVITNNDYTLF